jgi:hypothetical protein
MARRKNVKRIDPRYFLNETVNRNDDGSVFEEGKREEIQALIDAGMISPEEAKNMLAGRRADQAAPGAPIPGLSDLGPDEVDVDPLQEAEGETPEDIAARLKNIPVTSRAGAVNDFFNMMDGSTEMTGHYPHVEDHREFATQVLKLLGEIPASFRFTGRV